MRGRNRTVWLFLFLTVFLPVWGACTIISLGIVARASFGEDTVSINARIKQADTDSIIESLNSGNTVRVVWIIGLPGGKLRFCQYARKDAVGDGYHLFESVTDTHIQVFSDSVALMDSLLVLKDYKIYLRDEVAEWESLRIQAYIDENLKTPPLSVISVFSRSMSPRLKIEREDI